MGNYHLTSMFFKAFKKSNTLSVRKSNPAYSFLEREYQNEFAKDGNDNLLVRMEIEEIRRKRNKLIQFKRNMRRISIGSSAYDFFVNEYRQNTPMRDAFGNIVLSDDEVLETISRSR